MQNFMSSASLPIAGGVGTVGWRVWDINGVAVTPRKTTDVFEAFTGDGYALYGAYINLQANKDMATVVWDDGAGNASITQIGDFCLLKDGLVIASAELPIADGEGEVGFTVYGVDGTVLQSRNIYGVVQVYDGDDYGIYQCTVQITDPLVEAGAVVIDDGQGNAVIRSFMFVEPAVGPGPPPEGPEKTIKFCVVKDGALVTPPYAPVLDSPAHQYGVARTDTGAAVVASGTGMTPMGGGLYGHTFDQPEENLDYRYYVHLIEAFPGSSEYYIPSTTNIVDSAMLAIGKYTDSHEVEKRFGADNVHLWLSLPGGDTDEPVDYALRAWRFINDAEEYINSRLCGAFYDGSWLEPPISPQVRRAAMLLSGVFMYEARGVSDRDDADGEPQHRLRHERDEADKIIDQLAAGRGCTGNGNNRAHPIAYPMAFADDPCISLEDCDGRHCH